VSLPHNDDYHHVGDVGAHVDLIYDRCDDCVGFDQDNEHCDVRDHRHRAREPRHHTDQIDLIPYEIELST
jgi:hypothetical protein